MQQAINWRMNHLKPGVFARRDDAVMCANVEVAAVKAGPGFYRMQNMEAYSQVCYCKACFAQAHKDRNKLWKKLLK